MYVAETLPRLQNVLMLDRGSIKRWTQSLHLCWEKEQLQKVQL